MAIFNFDSSKFTTNLNSVQKTVTSSISTAGSKFNDLVNGLSQGGMSVDGIKNFVASSAKNSILKSDPRVSPEKLITGRSKAMQIGSSPEKIIRPNYNPKNDIFPADLSDEFFFQLELATYKRPDPYTDKTQFDTEYTLNLPLPTNLSETHSVMLNTAETGIMGGAANVITNIANSLQGAGSAAAADVGSKAMESLNDAAGFGYYLARPLLDAVGSGVSGLVGQALGNVPNPHLTVFFEGVNIRSNIEFSWLLAPRNKAEAERISIIIKNLRQRVLPKVNIGAQNILEYPMMSRITLFPWGRSKDPKKQKWMPTYKRGLIDSLTVDWAPSGISLFNDQNAAPAFCILSFVFQEIEIFTAQDYGAGEKDIIDPSPPYDPNSQN